MLRPGHLPNPSFPPPDDPIYKKMKLAKIKYGKYYCECGNLVHKQDKYCSQCGAELKIIPCLHNECYSKRYVDYDRFCYSIYCIECDTEVADVRSYDYDRIKMKYNIVKEY